MDKEESRYIIEVNEVFYQALATRDLKLMESVWKNDSFVGCVHPGWIMFHGWDAIKQSWENVFDPNDQLDIKLLNVNILVKKDIAWLTCIQHLTYIHRDPIFINVSQSTNIFEKHDNRWLMVLHHASPIPIPEANTSVTTLQ